MITSPNSLTAAAQAPISNNTVTVRSILGPTGPGHIGPTGAIGAAGPVYGGVGANGPAGAIHAGMGGGGAGVVPFIGAGGYGIVGGAGGGGGLAYTPMPPSPVSFDPSNSLSMRVNGHKAPMTDVFLNCRDVFLTDVQICEDATAHFHFMVWEAIHDNEVRDYGSVLRSGDGLYVAFGSERSRTDFENWIRNYARRFFPLVNLSDHKLPIPRPGDLKGVYVPDMASRDEVGMFMSGVTNAQFKDWVWIANNCYQQVYRIGDGWLFERDAEAIHFKMR
jgi:hypothetical protein